MNFVRTKEITPIVKNKEDPIEKRGVVKFDFLNEYNVTSEKWSDNLILIKCQDYEKKIRELKQAK